jgi:hypothetical protein
VISQGVLEPLDGTGTRLEVVYGFLKLPCDDDQGETLSLRISAISVQSVEGVFLSPGRYRLTTKEGLNLQLDRNNVGWQLVHEPRMPMRFAPTITGADLSAAVPK